MARCMLTMSSRCSMPASSMAGRIRCASAGRRRSLSSSARRGSPSRAAASSTGSRLTITARMAGSRAGARDRVGTRRDHRGNHQIRLARPRRRRLSDRHQMADDRASQSAAEIHRLQRRRGRFRHLRRPHDHGRRSVRADRGHGDRRHRRRRDRRATSISARNIRTRSRSSAAPSTSRGASDASAPAFSVPHTISTSRSASAPAPMSAARKPRCSTASKASAAWCAPSRRCRRIKGLFGQPTVVNNVISLASVPAILADGADAYRDLGYGPLARHDADPARRQCQVSRAVRSGLRAHSGRAGRRYRRRHGDRPAGARGAGRRPARRLFPARAVRHAVRLRSLHREERADRPWRRGRVRRHRRHGAAGALRDGVLRDRILRQMHALPHRLDARRRGHRPDHRGRAAQPRIWRC